MCFDIASKDGPGRLLCFERLIWVATQASSDCKRSGFQVQISLLSSIHVGAQMAKLLQVAMACPPPPTPRGAARGELLHLPAGGARSPELPRWTVDPRRGLEGPKGWGQGAQGRPRAPMV